MEELLVSVKIDSLKEFDLMKKRGLFVFVPIVNENVMSFVGLKIEYGFAWDSECEKIPLSQIEQYILVDYSTTEMKTIVKPTFFQENERKFKRAFNQKTRVRITCFYQKRKKMMNQNTI